MAPDPDVERLVARTTKASGVPQQLQDPKVAARVAALIVAQRDEAPALSGASPIAIRRQGGCDARSA